VVASSIAKLSNDAFVSAATADACSMVNLVCLFVKPHMLRCCKITVLHALLFFLLKLSEYVRNITAFCQHLLRSIKLANLADTDISVKPKYQLIYQLISISVDL